MSILLLAVSLDIQLYIQGSFATNSCKLSEVHWNTLHPFSNYVSFSSTNYYTKYNIVVKNISRAGCGFEYVNIETLNLNFSLCQYHYQTISHAFGEKHK